MKRLGFVVCLASGHEFDSSQEMLHARAQTERGDPRMERECERCGLELRPEAR